MVRSSNCTVSANYCMKQICRRRECSEQKLFEFVIMYLVKDAVIEHNYYHPKNKIGQTFFRRR